MAASQEAKAQELLVKAEKRLNSWTNFLSGENKYDAAAEMYSKAANLFKVSKNWSEAGKVLVGIPLETGQKQYTVDFKLETYLKIAR